MKKVILLAMAVFFAFSATAFAQTVPADKVKINLAKAWNVKATQKGVLFDHTPHLAKLNNKCDSCHSSPQGGTKMNLQGPIQGANAKNPAHNFCWSCHDKVAKPNKTPGKTCTKCHTQPK